MHRFLIILALFSLMACGSPAPAAVLVQSTNGTYVTKTDIYTANTAADSVGKRIKVTGAITLNANLTLSTDRAWDFTDCVITTTGYTLNINGADVLMPVDKQVFTGTGAVTGFKEPVKVVWFGENTSPGTTVMTTPIQRAIDAAVSAWNPATYGSSSPSGVPTVKFKAELYKSGALNISKSVLLEGDGPTEFSAGTRILSTAITNNSSLVTVDPVSQGCSFQMRNITLRGGGTGTGNLLTIKNTLATVNSIRLSNVVFGTPDALALVIYGSDDVIIDKMLVDVVATNALAFDTVSNVRIIAPTFFGVNLKTLILKDVQNLTIIAPHAYTSNSSTYADQFIDGVDLGGTYLRNIKVIGGNFQNYNILSAMANSKNTQFIGNTLTRSVKNAADTKSIVSFTGTMDGLTFTNNIIESGLATNKFFETNNATITQNYTVANNSFINLGSAAGKAWALGQGADLSSNNFTGFSDLYASHRQLTSGNAVSPGTLAAGASYTYNMTQIGASQTRNIIVSPASTSWIAPAGIVVTAYASAPDTVSVQYTNVTASPIGVPAHDISVLVVN